jgi:hypothetical protein
MLATLGMSAARAGIRAASRRGFWSRLQGVNGPHGRARAVLQREKPTALMQLGAMRLASTTAGSYRSRFSSAAKLWPYAIMLGFYGVLAYSAYDMEEQRALREELSKLPGRYNLEPVGSIIKQSKLQQQLQLNDFELRLMAMLVHSHLKQADPRYDDWADEARDRVAACIEKKRSSFECLAQFKGMLDSANFVKAADRLIAGDFAQLEPVLKQLERLKQQDGYADYLKVVSETELVDLPKKWDSSFKTAAHLAFYLAVSSRYELSVEQINQLNIRPFSKEVCDSGQLKTALGYLLERENLEWPVVVALINKSMLADQPSAKLMQAINEHKICQTLNIPMGSVDMSGIAWDPETAESAEHYQHIAYLVAKAGQTPQQAVDYICASDRVEGTPYEKQCARSNDPWPGRIELMKEKAMPFSKAKDLHWGQMKVLKGIEIIKAKEWVTQDQLEAAGLVETNLETGRQYVFVDDAFANEMFGEACSWCMSPISDRDWLNGFEMAVIMCAKAPKSDVELESQEAVASTP